MLLLSSSADAAGPSLRPGDARLAPPGGGSRPAPGSHTAGGRCCGANAGTGTGAGAGGSAGARTGSTGAGGAGAPPPRPP